MRLHLPPSLVCHHSSQLLRCTTEEDLQVTPTWHLHRDGEVYDITNGTQSRVTSRKQETSVAIKHVSKLWTGAEGRRGRVIDGTSSRDVTPRLLSRRAVLVRLRSNVRQKPVQDLAQSHWRNGHFSPARHHRVPELSALPGDFRESGGSPLRDRAPR